MFKEPEIKVIRLDVADIMSISGDSEWGGGDEE